MFSSRLATLKTPASGNLMLSPNAISYSVREKIERRHEADYRIPKIQPFTAWYIRCAHRFARNIGRIDAWNTSSGRNGGA